MRYDASRCRPPFVVVVCEDAVDLRHRVRHCRRDPRRHSLVGKVPPHTYTRLYSAGTVMNTYSMPAVALGSCLSAPLRHPP